MNSLTSRQSKQTKSSIVKRSVEHYIELVEVNENYSESKKKMIIIMIR